MLYCVCLVYNGGPCVLVICVLVACLTRKHDVDVNDQVFWLQTVTESWCFTVMQQPQAKHE